MNEGRETLADAVIELQAQVSALSSLLRAVVMTHPQPKAMRDAWDRLVAPKLVAGLQTAVTRPDRAKAKEAAEYWTRLWTERLAESIRGSEPRSD